MSTTFDTDPTTESASNASAEEGSAPAPVDVPVTVIEPHNGWRLIDWAEIWAYRDLFTFMVWRSVKVRYAQSTIGIGWAVIQPVFSMIVFTIVFGRLAKVSSEGVPYAVFSFTALVPWTYFSNALTEGASSLVSNSNMLKKVYFPRILMPMSAVAAKLVDFAIAMIVLGLLMAWYQQVPTWGILMLPYLTILMMITAAGAGMWLTALAVQYRDINYAQGFVVQLLMYAAPVVYPASLVPARFQYYYAINPMVGVIEGFRSALLGTRAMPWDLIAIGSLTAALILISGAFYFRRKERVFADVA